MTANPKPPRPIRDRKHMAFVGSLPCCITGSDFFVVYHHLLRGTDEKCAGRKSGDNWVIPLTSHVHTALHLNGNETEFLKAEGIDGPALAKALWDASGDYELACAILRGLHEEKAI